METAETKTIERMGEAFSQPTMKERFEEWAERTVSDAKKEKKEEKSGPREISLADRSPEEKEFIEAVAEKKDESGKKSPAKNSAEKDAANTEHRSDGKESGKPDIKAGEKAAASESTKAPVEPITGDFAERHWQGKLQGKEIETHISQVNARAELITKFLESHPQKAQMEQGFRALFANKPPAWQQAFFRDLAVSLAEVPNPGEVFRHITLQPEDREFLRNVKNGRDLRAAIRTVSKLYPAAASEASAKPRAPKPPSQVSGRSAPGDDGTRGEMDFSSFSDKQARRYAR